MQKIYIHKIDSPLGLLTVGATSKGICLLEFDNEQRIAKHLDQFNKREEVVLINATSDLIIQAEEQLKKYFNGELKTFDLQLDMVGTNFQLKVWKELLKVPYGITRSYKEQAVAVGDLKAIRAVATANGENRISIIIPCHRIIGADGSLTGYGGGIWRKQKLLELETNQTTLF